MKLLLFIYYHFASNTIPLEIEYMYKSKKTEFLNCQPFGLEYKDNTSLFSTLNSFFNIYIKLVNEITCLTKAQSIYNFILNELDKIEKESCQNRESNNDQTINLAFNCDFRNFNKDFKDMLDLDKQQDIEFTVLYNNLILHSDNIIVTRDDNQVWTVVIDNFIKMVKAWKKALLIDSKKILFDKFIKREVTPDMWNKKN